MINKQIYIIQNVSKYVPTEFFVKSLMLRKGQKLTGEIPGDCPGKELSGTGTCAG